MTSSELGHVKDRILDTSVGSVVVHQTGSRSGRVVKAIYMQTGCLIKHSTQGWGELTTWGRT